MAKPTPPYKAPNFSLPDETGEIKTNDDFRGKWLVLYFYPKDDTPGCTTEACSFRDAHSEITEFGANVVGISKDNQASHQKFKEKHSLNFTLLSDESGSVIEAYDAWGPKMFGKLGIQRKTFLIDKNGTVRKVYGRVTPQGHGEQVVADLKELSKKY